IFNTHFWTYISDYFDINETRRLFPYFPIGNSLGGVAGGVLMFLLAPYVPAEHLAWSWVVALLATWWLIIAISPRFLGFVLRDAEEADDTSLNNLRQGMLFLRRSTLGRWHVFYAALMVMCLFFLQFGYSCIFAQQYGSSQALAGFLGVFLAIA